MRVLSHSMNILVETIHKSSLEFVLNHIDIANEVDHFHTISTFSQDLWDSLKKDLGDLATVTDYEEYGNYSFNVMYDNINDRQKILKICEQCINKWITRHRINYMVDNT